MAAYAHPRAAGLPRALPRGSGAFPDGDALQGAGEGRRRLVVRHDGQSGASLGEIRSVL